MLMQPWNPWSDQAPEFLTCVQAPELATWHDGEDWYPTCFRDSSEIRLPEAEADLDRPPGTELEAQ